MYNPMLWPPNKNDPNTPEGQKEIDEIVEEFSQALKKSLQKNKDKL